VGRSAAKRNVLIHRDRVEHAELTQSRASSAAGDDLIGGLLGLIGDIAAPTQQVLSIELRGVRAKLTIQGKWGMPECEQLRRALGDKLGAGRS
jgi:hypothetical protein